MYANCSPSDKNYASATNYAFFEIHAAKNLGGEGQTPPNGYSIIV